MPLSWYQESIKTLVSTDYYGNDNERGKGRLIYSYFHSRIYYTTVYVLLYAVCLFVLSIISYPLYVNKKEHCLICTLI